MSAAQGLQGVGRCQQGTPRITATALVAMRKASETLRPVLSLCRKDLRPKHFGISTQACWLLDLVLPVPTALVLTHCKLWGNVSSAWSLKVSICVMGTVAWPVMGVVETFERKVSSLKVSFSLASHSFFEFLWV